MMNCTAHNMQTLREPAISHANASIFYVMLALGYILGGPGLVFPWRRSDIGKLAPAGLDRLKMPFRKRKSVRTQLKSWIADTAQYTDVREGHKSER